MKRILTILFVLVNSVIFSQATLTDLNLVFDISESNSYSSPFVVKGTVLHSTSEYNGNDINVGDLVYFQDGTTTYSLPIVTIDSQSYSYVELQLLDISSTVSYVPTGRAALIRTSNPDLLPVPPDGIPSDLEAGILNDLRLKIQGGVTAAEEITDYTGGIISSPMFPPAVSPSSYTGKTWRNSMGVLYRSDGVAWTPIGGAAFDTLYTDATNQLLVLQGPNDSLSTSIIDIAPVQQITGGTGISVVPYPGGVFNIVNAGDLSNTNEIELPSQVGNNLKALYTNGTSPYWGTVASSIDTFGVYGPNLLVSLLNDGQPAKSVTASSILSAANGVSGTIASGQVAYGSGTNTIVGNNNFYWDSSNGILGIGNPANLATPYKLQVSGAATYRNALFTATEPISSLLDIRNGAITARAGTTDALWGAYIKGTYTFNTANQVFGGLKIDLSSNATASQYVEPLSIDVNAATDATSRISNTDATGSSTLSIVGSTSGLVLRSPNGGNSGGANPGYNYLSPTGNFGWCISGSTANGLFVRSNTTGTNPNAVNGSFFVRGDNTFIGNAAIPTFPATLTVKGIDNLSTGWTAQFHNSTGTSNSLMIRNDGKVAVGSNMTTANDYGTFNVNGKFTAETEFIVGRADGLFTSYLTGLVREAGVAGGLGTGNIGQAELYTYGTGGFAIGTATGAAPFTISTNGIERIRVAASGPITLKDYPNTLNTAGNPVNVLSTSSTGVVESHPISEVISAAGAVTGTGANGRITYWTGASTQSGTDNLFWSGTNLGIGTATPASRLHTKGGGEQYWQLETTSNGYSGILFKNGTQVENRLYFNSTSGNDGTFILGSSGGGGGNNKKLAISGGVSIGTSYLSTDISTPNSLIVEGNTGFGTISPTRKLHVAGGNPFIVDVAGYSMDNIVFQSTTPKASQYGFGIQFKDASDGLATSLLYKDGTFMFGGNGAGFNSDGNKRAHFHGGVTIGSGLLTQYNTNGIISEGNVSINSTLSPAKLFIRADGVGGSTSAVIITNNNGDPLVPIFKLLDNGILQLPAYLNTVNSAGSPVNILSTSSTGVLESHTAAELVSTGISASVGAGQVAYGTGTGITGSANVTTDGTELKATRISVGASGASDFRKVLISRGSTAYTTNAIKIGTNIIWNTTTGGVGAYLINLEYSYSSAGNIVPIVGTIQLHIQTYSGTGVYFHAAIFGEWGRSTTATLYKDASDQLVVYIGEITDNGPMIVYLRDVLATNSPATGGIVTSIGGAANTTGLTSIATCSNIVQTRTIPFILQNNVTSNTTNNVLKLSNYNGGVNTEVGIQFLPAGGATANPSDATYLHWQIAAKRYGASPPDLIFKNLVGQAAKFANNGNFIIGNSDPLAKLHVIGSGNNSTTWTAQFHNNATNNALMIRDDGNIGIGTASPVGKLHIKGAGAASNVAILNVENGTPNNVFSVMENGDLVGINNNFQPFYQGSTGRLVTSTVQTNTGTTGILGLKGGYTGGGGVVVDAWTTVAHTTGDYKLFATSTNFVPPSGNATFSFFSTGGTINQSSGATGITRGFWMNSSLNSPADFRAFEASNTSGKGFWQTGASVINAFAGSTMIGSAGTPSQTLHVAGTARITGSAGTATLAMGRDANGNISDLGLGSGLSITSGVLNVTSTGATNLAVTGTSSPLTLTSDTGTDVTFTAGTGVSLTGTSGNITINATEVDGSITNEIQNLSLSGQTLSISGGTSATLPVVGITAGTGITATPTAGNYTITNTGDTNAGDDLLTSTIFDGDVEGTWDALTLKTNVVGEDNIIDGSITAFKLATQSATNGQVLTYGGALVGWVPSSAVGDVAGPITNLQIGANAVGTTELNNGAVTMAKINQASATTGQVITWNGTAWAPATPTTGPTYTAGTGINISSNVITNTGDTNAADDLTTSTSFSGDVTGLYNNLQIAANAVGTTELADNSVSANKIGDSQVTMAKINQSSATSGQIISWNGTTWAPSNIGYGGATDAIGTAESLTVTKIQNRGIATTSPTTGQVLAWSGSLWAPASPGLTNLNGQNGTSQTFFASSTGSDFGITSSGNVHTFALPTANATQTGKLTSSDWSTFSSKIGGSGANNQLAVFNGTGTITSSTGATYNGTVFSISGEVVSTGVMKPGTLGTSPTVIVGRNASNQLSTVGVGAGLDFTGGTLSASNFYTADGTLTGSRIVTTGNLNIAFDASTSVTNNANPIRVKGISTSGNTYYPLIFQNESNADKLSFKVGASEVSMLTTTENLKLGTGSQQWILNNVGSITMPALASNPTTANSSVWVNSTTNRLMVKTPDGNVKSIATLQDDLSGGNLQFSTSQSIGNTNFGNEITNTLTADITITLDGTLTEGREYKVFNSNDGATWDTFWTVASGYTVKLKDVGNVTSADGLLTMNPYRLFIITRYGNTIYVSY